MAEERESIQLVSRAEAQEATPPMHREHEVMAAGGHVQEAGLLEGGVGGRPAPKRGFASGDEQLGGVECRDAVELPQEQGA